MSVRRNFPWVTKKKKMTRLYQRFSSLVVPPSRRSWRRRPSRLWCLCPLLGACCSCRPRPPRPRRFLGARVGGAQRNEVRSVAVGVLCVRTPVIRSLSQPVCCGIDVAFSIGAAALLRVPASGPHIGPQIVAEFVGPAVASGPPSLAAMRRQLQLLSQQLQGWHEVKGKVKPPSPAPRSCLLYTSPSPRDS